MEKPTAAFVLSLIGGILILLGGIFRASVSIFFGWLRGLIVILGFLGLIFGTIVIIGAIMIHSGEKDKVRTGSILVLIFSILSLFVGGRGGFIIGFILGLVGSILGLTWKPAEAPPPPPPT